MKWFNKIKKEQTNYRIALKDLKEDYNSKVIFSFEDNTKVINLTKNHLDYYYKSDDENTFNNFVDEMRSPYWHKYAFGKSKLSLKIKFGRLTELTINITKKDGQEFLEKLYNWECDFRRRLLKRIDELNKFNK